MGLSTSTFHVSLSPRESYHGSHVSRPWPVCLCRKKDREAKKFSKQVAAERKKERAQEKKKAITDVSKLRKQREKSVRPT